MRHDVDVLQLAAWIARVVRNADDRRAQLESLLHRFGGDASASDTATLCLQLAKAAQSHEADLHAALREAIKTRKVRPASEPLVAASPEAAELMAWMHEHRESGVVISEGHASFNVVTREVGIDPPLEAFDPRSALRTFLVDYPLAAPLVFRDTTSLSFVEVCERIADAYAEIYSDTKKFGVYGHDRSDLVIERILWFPERELIHPEMGS